MKKLSLTLSAILFIASNGVSYSFDLNRFYSDATQPLETSPSGGYPADDVHNDTFELAPSGRIDKISTDVELNTKRFGVSHLNRQAGDTTERRSNVAKDSKLNTLYSDLYGANRLNGECGPSPLTPAQIEELVARTAQSYGVDPGLAKAIAWTESRFDRNRNSHQGARGPMQLMPATATGLGVNDICDPASNIDGGVRHLKLMLEEFQNPILAVAAYNAGAQAIYDSGGVPPFGETIRYVAEVFNHQMGVQMPHKAAARGHATGAISPSSNEMASDVIGARGSRFIKGVMQF